MPEVTTQRSADSARHRPLAIRISRYTVGSVVAFGTSEIVLLVTFGTGLLGASVASVVAFVAGAIPNYVLNRRWVWGQRGRVRVRGELVPYIAISLITLVAAAAATGWAASVASDDAFERLIFVGGAYLVTYGVLFVLKFVAYDRFVFNRATAS
jgi:putative flippase GtrA